MDTATPMPAVMVTATITSIKVKPRVRALISGLPSGRRRGEAVAAAGAANPEWVVGAVAERIAGASGARVEPRLLPAGPGGRAGSAVPIRARAQRHHVGDQVHALHDVAVAPGHRQVHLAHRLGDLI